MSDQDCIYTILIRLQTQEVIYIVATRKLKTALVWDKGLTSTHFASSVSAMAPEATEVAAVVPLKSSTHPPSAPVVAYGGGSRYMHL